MRDLFHRPVMCDEVLTHLNPKLGDVMVDCTLGGGGHTELLLERVGKSGKVIGIDKDNDALEFAKKRLERFGSTFVAARGSYSAISEIVKQNVPSEKVDGVLMDLGVSSHQLDEASRGFSFETNGPLDMRMSTDEGMTVEEVVNTLSQEALTAIIRDYGEEHFALQIARGIVNARKHMKISDTLTLREIILKSVPKKGLMPAKTLSRVFQSFRIYVNMELHDLEQALHQMPSVLAPGGRLVVISYHSLEDAIVKRFFRKMSGVCICPPGLPKCGCGLKSILKMNTTKAILPTPEECEKNRRARSAKLRSVTRADD